MKWMLAIDVADKRSPQVIDEAARWAGTVDATLDLVYAEGARYGYEFITDPYVRDLMAAEVDKLRKVDEEQLHRLLARIPEKLRGGIQMLAGRPVDTILDAAAGYDMVLVATHGRTGLSHFWLGSVAEQVVRRSKVPVLVLRLPPES